MSYPKLKPTDNFKKVFEQVHVVAGSYSNTREMLVNTQRNQTLLAQMLYEIYKEFEESEKQ